MTFHDFDDGKFKLANMDTIDQNTRDIGWINLLINQFSLIRYKPEKDRTNPLKSYI